MQHWILDADGEPQAVDDVLTWASWFETHSFDRAVLQETVAPGIDVSTVFLALDHAWDGGPPVLWVTMIFGGPFDQYQRRYTSKLAALEGHAFMVRLVELFRTAPRKTKKVLRKILTDGEPHAGLREARRFARALRRIASR